MRIRCDFLEEEKEVYARARSHSFIKGVIQANMLAEIW